jgi:hypothetical protein
MAQACIITESLIVSWDFLVKRLPKSPQITGSRPKPLLF